MFYYHYDITYIVLVLPFVFLSLWASHNVNSTYKKYNQQFSRRGITAQEAARRILAANGVTNVEIGRISGELTDHFDPSSNVIRLSDSVYDSTSTAAIGVACHEAGHALQYANGYFPMKIRAAVIPITNIGSRIAMPLIILGILFSFSAHFSNLMVNLGILCFSTSLIFQLVTLPVEFDASARALRCIDESQLLTDEEFTGAKRTLRAAALTYVAATAVAFTQLLRLLVIFSRRRD